MISLSIGDCKVDILPVVNGLESEAEMVRSAYGGYEAYGIPLGVEGIQALKDRARLEDEFEVSELDIAYANKMFDLTGEEVVMPLQPCAPSWTSSRRATETSSPST